MSSTARVLAALIEAVEALKKRLDDPAFQIKADIDALVREAIAKIEIPVAEPGEPGKPGRAPTAAEIEVAAAIWLEANRESLAGPRGLPGVKGATGFGARGLPGRDGADATPAQVYAAVEKWMERHRESLRGEPGKQGDVGERGVGVERIEQRAGSRSSFWVVLTNGEEYEVKMPTAQGGGGPTILAGGGSTTRRQEVFDSLAGFDALEYPALAFVAGVDGRTRVYLRRAI